MTKYEEKRLALEVFKNHRPHGADITMLITELEKAWAALEFYANINNYEQEVERHGYFDSSEWTYYPSEVTQDEGNIAREALNE